MFSRCSKPRAQRVAQSSAGRLVGAAGLGWGGRVWVGAFALLSATRCARGFEQRLNMVSPQDWPRLGGNGCHSLPACTRKASCSSCTVRSTETT